MGPGKPSIPEEVDNVADRPGGDSGSASNESNEKDRKQKRPPRMFQWIFRMIGGSLDWLKVLSKQWWAQTLGFFAVGFVFSRLMLKFFTPTAQVMYSDFVVFVEAGMVESAQFEHSSDHVHFTIKPEYLTRVGNQMRISLDRPPNVAATGKANKAKVKKNEEKTTGSGAKEVLTPSEKKMKFKLMARTLPGQSVPLHELLRKHRVRFGVVGSSLQSTLTRLLGTLAVLWIPLVPLFWFFRRSLNAQSNKKTKKVGASTPKVLFSDIAGMDQAKVELMEVISLLKNPQRFSKVESYSRHTGLKVGGTYIRSADFIMSCQMLYLGVD